MSLWACMTRTHFIGAGVLHKFGADVFLCFFLASIFQRDGMFKPFLGAHAFGAQIFMQIFAQMFCAQMFAQIFVAQIFCRIFSMCWCLKMCSESADKSAASQWLCPGGHSNFLSTFLSRQHVLQSPPGRSTQASMVASLGPKAYVCSKGSLKIKLSEKSTLRTTSIYPFCQPFSRASDTRNTAVPLSETWGGGTRNVATVFQATTASLDLGWEQLEQINPQTVTESWA